MRVFSICAPFSMSFTFSNLRITKIIIANRIFVKKIVMRILRSSILLFSFFTLLISSCELPQGATSSNSNNSQNANSKSVTSKLDTTTKLTQQQMRERMKNMPRETVPAEMMVKGSVNSGKSLPTMDSIP